MEGLLYTLKIYDVIAEEISKVIGEQEDMLKKYKLD